MADKWPYGFSAGWNSFEISAGWVLFGIFRRIGSPWNLPPDGVSLEISAGWVIICRRDAINRVSKPDGRLPRGAGRKVARATTSIFTANYANGRKC